jgi:hypothetical protein
MRTALALVVAFLLSAPCSGQDLQRYYALVSEANALYYQQDHLASARKYDDAIAALGGRGNVNDRYNAACSWALASQPDSAFVHLRAAAVDGGFSDAEWLLADTDLASLHGDPRWEEVVNLVRANQERMERSRKPVGAYYYTRMMLLFKVKPEALAARLPEGWAVQDYGWNVVIGFCDVWSSRDANGKLVPDSQVRYIPINGGAWDTETGEVSNVRYTEYADHPEGLITTSPEDVARGTVVPARIHRESSITRSDSLGELYHEYWRIEPEGGGLLELRATFPHEIDLVYEGGMEVVYADNPERRLHYSNDEVQNVIMRRGHGDRLVKFSYTVELPGWEGAFDGTEEVVGVRFIPASKREVYEYREH